MVISKSVISGLQYREGVLITLDSDVALSRAPGHTTSTGVHVFGPHEQFRPKQEGIFERFVEFESHQDLIYSFGHEPHSFHFATFDAVGKVFCLLSNLVA
jgi:hypothetical protein